jgi:hypothetical protein
VGLDLVSANSMPPSKKTPRAPNRNGGVFEIPIQIDWLDKTGSVVSSTQTVIPLGTRVPVSEGNTVPGVILPENLVILRVPGPDPGGAEQIRVSPMATFAA